MDVTLESLHEIVKTVIKDFESTGKKGFIIPKDLSLTHKPIIKEIYTYFITNRKKFLASSSIAAVSSTEGVKNFKDFYK